MRLADIQNSLNYYFFKLQKAGFKKCLAPEGLGLCSKKTIRAHSIQNRQILDIIQRDGHVVMLNARLDLKKGISVNFEFIGRNKATTFTGICSNHDRKIFAPIEENNIDVDNELHLFLLAYRAVFKQTFATCDAAVQQELISRKKREFDLLSKNVLTDEDKLVLNFSLNSYKTYLYKVEFDKIFLNKYFDKICHRIIKFSSTVPTIAVNSLITPRDNLQKKSTIGRIAINIFPTTRYTFVVFSYLKCDEPFVRPYLDDILHAENQYCRYLVSKLVLRNCENFVISPNHFDTINEDSRKAIIGFFISTIIEDRLDHEDKRLSLF